MNKIILLLIFLGTGALAQNINNGLLLEYKFDGNADDSSGNGYHGTNYRTSFVNDRFGNPFSAAFFNGIDSYIDLPNLLELKPALPVSFSFWIRYDSNDSKDRDVFNTSFKEDESSGVYFNSQASTGKYAVNYGDGSSNYTSATRKTYVSNSVIEVGEWHHVVVIVSSALNMKIYVDCAEISGTYSGSGGELKYSDTPGSIGRHDRDIGIPANYFKGALDDFRYWNRELTQIEVESLCIYLSTSNFSKVEQDVKVYSIPGSGVIKIKSSIDFDKVAIFNTLGERVYYGGHASEIHLKRQAKGIYFVKLSFNGQIISKKFALL